MISEKYAVSEIIKDQIEEFKIQDPETFPDLGIWHPLAPCMFESLKEYQNWDNERKDINPKDDKTPTMNIIKVVKETSSAFFDFIVFINWGRNAAVVKIAAKYPNISTFIKIF